jgi:hypothetical protein
MRMAIEKKLRIEKRRGLQWNFYLRFDVIHVNNLFTA